MWCTICTIYFSLIWVCCTVCTIYFSLMWLCCTVCTIYFSLMWVWCTVCTIYFSLMWVCCTVCTIYFSLMWVCCTVCIVCGPCLVKDIIKLHPLLQPNHNTIFRMETLNFLNFQIIFTKLVILPLCCPNWFWLKKLFFPGLFLGLFLNLKCVCEFSEIKGQTITKDHHY